MINLRTQLNKILKTIHPRVYFQTAPDTATFPYVTYDLPNSFTNEEQDIFNLDVDIWDMPVNGDTTQIETLASSFWKSLNKYRYIDENIQFSIYKMNRLSLKDDDVRIKRRKLIFQLRYYDRKVNE